MLTYMVVSEVLSPALLDQPIFVTSIFSFKCSGHSSLSVMC